MSVRFYPKEGRSVRASSQLTRRRLETTKRTKISRITEEIQLGFFVRFAPFFVSFMIHNHAR